MGLTIHYSGTFKKEASLSAMIEEIRDIAEAHQWAHNIFETAFPAGSFGKSDYNDQIYGINFTPPDCETVSLTFLSNGRMSSYPSLHFFGKTAKQSEQDFLYMQFTKTQFAGVETHKFIIHLFRYLQGKYFHRLDVNDEGQYWETNDALLLEETFARYTNMIDSFANAVEIFPMENGEGYEAYFRRLAKRIHKNKASDDIV